MLGAAALLWITLDAGVSTPAVDIAGGWTAVATAEASYRPMFVYPDVRSGPAGYGGFRIAHAAGTATTLALVGRAGATYADDWRTVFEASAEASWRDAIELRAGARHDNRLRREGALADFRDPTGRLFAGATVLPLRKGAFAAGAAFDYERAMPGAGRLPSAVRVSVVGRFQVRSGR